MKISIAWIFDHIDADRSVIDIPDLIKRFNETTAEIEGCRIVAVDLDSLALVQVRDVAKKVGAYCPEWHQEMSLESRDDVAQDAWYLVSKQGNGYRWATTVDLGGEKEMLLPALHVDQKLQAGQWKKGYETSDCILTIDNKSITHRPDLWGHRGFAREIAAIFDLPLKPLDTFLVTRDVQKYDRSVTADNKFPCSITLSDETACDRFAGFYIPTISMKSSPLHIATRLARVDSRAINAVVDFTNYVMLDLSQPMHAFDMAHIAGKSIEVRFAKNKEKLLLLDDQSITLSSHDLVVADTQKPLALAGVMGGKYSGISADTKAVFLEAAHFDATTIRRAAQRHKVRTEASARFEKSLDPNQNVSAILRFLQLLEENAIECDTSGVLASVGKEALPLKLDVTHSFIESCLGATMASDFVVDILTKLQFDVSVAAHNDDTIYHIVVPTFRSTKDVTIKEDIVEEIGRFYGYDSLQFVLPQRATKPVANYATHQMMRIKRFLAYGLSMRELYSYALFDESFLRTMQWDPGDTGAIKAPVSENQRRLVTTLIPHLLKAVHENSVDHEQLRFFESGRFWHETPQKLLERKGIAGIMFEKKRPIDFYEMKAELEQLFAMLELPVSWRPPEAIAYPWFDHDQTAALFYGDTQIGMAGIAAQSVSKQLFEGNAFLFELDGNFLEQYEVPLHRFVPVAKYPAVDRDISMLVPLSVSVDSLRNTIAGVDELIEDVFLVDMFRKKEWKDQRSLTFRYVMRDSQKTMTKAEADTIESRVARVVHKLGVTIR